MCLLLCLLCCAQNSSWCCTTCFTSAVQLLPHHLHPLFVTLHSYSSCLQLPSHILEAALGSLLQWKRGLLKLRDVSFSISEAVIDIAVFNTPKGHSTVWNLFPNIKNRTQRLNKHHDANWDGSRQRLPDPLTSVQHICSLWNTAWENQLHSFYFKCRRIPWVSSFLLK